tara:strand:- start:80 stop:265 length:186 start_codon:yes stop_codon:yes gene_type:complete
LYNPLYNIYIKSIKMEIKPKEVVLLEMFKNAGEFLYEFSAYILEQIYETDLLYPLEEAMKD